MKFVRLLVAFSSLIKNEKNLLFKVMKKLVLVLGGVKSNLLDCQNALLLQKGYSALKSVHPLVLFWQLIVV